jgi:hypothetical protein
MNLAFDTETSALMHNGHTHFLRVRSMIMPCSMGGAGLLTLSAVFWRKVHPVIRTVELPWTILLTRTPPPCIRRDNQRKTLAEPVLLAYGLLGECGVSGRCACVGVAECALRGGELTQNSERCRAYPPVITSPGN